MTLISYIYWIVSDSQIYVVAKLKLELRCYLLAVMGDAGRLYVSGDVIPLYRSLLPKAFIITPNWFEAE
jgi:pyridoxine kinase